MNRYFLSIEVECFDRATAYAIMDELFDNFGIECFIDFGNSCFNDNDVSIDFDGVIQSHYKTRNGLLTKVEKILKRFEKVTRSWLFDAWPSVTNCNTNSRINTSTICK